MCSLQSLYCSVLFCSVWGCCVLSGITSFSSYSFIFFITVSGLCLFLSSAWCITSCILFSFDLLDIIFFRLLVSWKVLLSPSTMTDSLAKHSSLCWQSWYFKMCSSRLLSFRKFLLRNKLFFRLVFLEMWLLLFLLVAFNNLYSFCIFNALLMICHLGISFLILHIWCFLFLVSLWVYFLSLKYFHLWFYRSSCLWHWVGILLPHLVLFFFNSVPHFLQFPVLCF